MGRVAPSFSWGGRGYLRYGALIMATSATIPRVAPTMTNPIMPRLRMVSMTTSMTRSGTRVTGHQPGQEKGPADDRRALFSECESYSAARTSRSRAAVSLGVLPTLTPAASRASFFPCAVPAPLETMAPAWPMVLPSGAVKPAT
jgi:hypothetical protein